MKSYAQLAFNSRCKDITDFIKVVVQKTHKICAKNALLIFLILLLQNFHSFSLLFFWLIKYFYIFLAVCFKVLIFKH